ncbi:MAG TPA: EndoU domain-containing protein [Patescibacteria group bacterium]|nr:EndoU domain-containing protein [Patescibacteria group bacterium]
MRSNRFLKRLFMFAFFAALIFPAMLGQLGKINPFNPLKPMESKFHPQLSEARRQHILHGDATGGGHLHGVGHACKSEFPADWNEERVVETVTRLAANDNLGWKQQRNGNYVAEADEGTVRVRIVLDDSRTEIITAYPVNQPLNPCGRAPANDNAP